MTLLENYNVINDISNSFIVTSLRVLFNYNLIKKQVKLIKIN